jgi:hypothetical protein
METKSAVWLRLLETFTMSFQKIDTLLSVLISIHMKNTPQFYYLYVAQRHVYVQGIWPSSLNKY